MDSYATDVGMWQYLAINTTHPDISFAVSQVSRFTHNPKKSHSTAIKTIICYLKRTKDKGTYLDQSVYKAAIREGDIPFTLTKASTKQPIA
jgi:hypothetical protein